MKQFLFLMFFFFLLTTYSNADYLNTRTSNHCIYSVEPYQDSSGLCYIDRHTGDNVCDKRLSFDDLLDGYEFVDGGCYLKKDLEYLQLSENQFNYQMAFIGNLMGFSFMFLILFISVLMGRK